VKWDEPALPNGGEPEHPAPVLELTSDTGEAPPAPDMAPTAQAGAALILAAIGVVAALVTRRRT
jgi:hypothetical protein